MPDDRSLAVRFRVRGLDPAPFSALFELDDAALRAQGARRVIADADGGYPDRVSLRDAKAGDTLLLVNHCSVERGPFRATHAIFVNQASHRAFDATGAVPPMLRTRLLSLRAFDAADDLIAADVVDGADVEPVLARLLALPRVAFVNAHFAKHGCFACRFERA